MQPRPWVSQRCRMRQETLNHSKLTDPAPPCWNIAISDRLSANAKSIPGPESTSTGSLLLDSLHVCATLTDKNLFCPETSTIEGPLVIYVRYHWHVVCLSNDVIASEDWKKLVQARRTSSISRQFICQERHLSVQIPQTGRPSKTWDTWGPMGYICHNIKP